MQWFLGEQNKEINSKRKQLLNGNTPNTMLSSSTVMNVGNYFLKRQILSCMVNSLNSMLSSSTVMNVEQFFLNAKF